jgi:ribosome-associated translation inhibitor RaiA
MTKYSDQSYNLLIEIDTHECKLEQEDIDRMLRALSQLGRQVEHFPISDLRILVAFNHRELQYTVKTTLILTGTTLVNSEHGREVYSTFERCLDSLSENVSEYKQKLDAEPERHKILKGTHQEVEPTLDPDLSQLNAAVEGNDYDAFREATFGYEEPIRKRAGRWVERYPEVEARIDHGIKMEDIVEGVFLRAFEQFPTRPDGLRFGDWLESLIDPTVKAFQRDGEMELENIRMIRSAREAR